MNVSRTLLETEHEFVEQHLSTKQECGKSWYKMHWAAHDFAGQNHDQTLTPIRRCRTTYSTRCSYFQEGYINTQTLGGVYWKATGVRSTINEHN
jgi:hypothetical protein